MRRFFQLKKLPILTHIVFLILTSYIGLVWSCRNEQFEFGLMKQKLLSRIKYNIKTILLCPGISNVIRTMLQELDAIC